MRGKFITVEGIEGAGKSTALRFIETYLQHAHKNVLLTREPGGTPLAETIRETILHTKYTESIAADTELLLVFAARNQHLQTVILPALVSGTWVLSDRFIDASYAYQGGGRGVASDKIQALDQWIVSDHYPDLTILMDVPPAVGLSRAEKRDEALDRIEQENQDFFVRVRKNYLERAHADSARIKIIDASTDLPAVRQQLRIVLDQFFAC